MCVVRVDCRKEGLATFILPFFYYKKGKNLTKIVVRRKKGEKRRKGREKVYYFTAVEINESHHKDLLSGFFSFQTLFQ